ncbi:MAG: hypothetical protein H0T86_04625 [Gemmatimonadales bacterium]|nr:hypothetical protein [Gemmatimonadales bacterium]
MGAIGIAGLALAGGVARDAPAGHPEAGYAAMAARSDTLRVRLAGNRPAERRRRTSLGTTVVGFLSPRGLPPIHGAFVVSDTGLVFRSSDGRYAATLPVVGPVRRSARGRWRASAVILAYVEERLGRRSYLFRVDGGVFETDAPGALMDVAVHPRWLDSLGSREWTRERPLVNGSDAAAVKTILGALMRSPYADSLYAVFGRPARPAGVVSEGGRAASRLGEYVATRDSIALDPGGMTSVGQLRHTLAHELAHRWQARSGSQLAMLWTGVPAIRDPKRYGYENRREHQAEATAFAVHFLLGTTTAGNPRAAAAGLEHYELLVPGTRAMARYLALQRVFAGHPLRPLLTTGRLQ